jgi:hypothetical protein
MINGFISSIIEKCKTFESKTTFLLLLLVSFFIRFPFFFRDYIDRDESTFILVAQSWVEGNLPFTELWDVKPPLTFFFFASIIYAFGKSIFTIRLFGVVLVAISSFFTYKIGSHLSTKKIGFWCAVGAVVLQSLFGSLQGVMSEHITMAFFMPAIYILFKNRSFFMVFIAGLLMGIALMVKLNMAYAVLFIGLYILFQYSKEKEYAKGFWNTLTYGVGILIIIGLTILPYFLENHLELWYNSVVRAPLEYAEARRYSILKLTPILVILSAFFFVIWKKGYIDFKNPEVQLLCITILGVVLSFIKGGRVNGHYLIQLHPLLIIFVGIIISEMSWPRTLRFKQLLWVLVLLIPVETYLEYGNIIKNKITKGTFFNGEGISVPAYVTENDLDKKNIFFLEYQIGYWFLNVSPPTKIATHPSNICKDEMFEFFDNPRKTSVEELKYIMEVLQPKTVVLRKDRRIFDKKEIEENAYIESYLSKHYNVHAVVEKAEILQRLEGF